MLSRSQEFLMPGTSPQAVPPASLSQVRNVYLLNCIPEGREKREMSWCLRMGVQPHLASP